MKIWKFTICDECGKEVESAIMLNGRQFGHAGKVEAVICLDCLKSAQQMLALDGELPCLACGGEVGHRINCPHGIAFSSVPRQ